MKKIALFCLTCLCLSTAMAETRYVTDVLYLQLRTGPGNDFRILKALRSGTHLEIVEEVPDSEFIKVRTDKGLEGYILSRFLEKEPVAFEKLLLTQQELEKTKKDLSDIQAKYSEIKSKAAEIEKSQQSLSTEKSEQEKELEYIRKVSANAINLDKKNQELVMQNEEIQIKNDTLQAENDRLKNKQELTTLMYGGALVVIGLIFGLVLPRISGRRQSSGW